MMNNKLKYTRRSLLRGAMNGAAVAMGLPVLESLLNDNGTAFADGTDLPPCFGSWFFGLGLTPVAGNLSWLGHSMNYQNISLYYNPSGKSLIFLVDYKFS